MRSAPPPAKVAVVSTRASLKVVLMRYVTARPAAHPTTGPPSTSRTAEWNKGGGGNKYEEKPFWAEIAALKKFWSKKYESFFPKKNMNVTTEDETLGWGANRRREYKRIEFRSIWSSRDFEGAENPHYSTMGFTVK